VFAFFDAWDWRLDDRPLRNESEINPDVLGYIFEKYVNQKQMGAYYTKEDITEYISKNTIIPFLFDHAQKLCANAFDARDGIWKLLREQPDRYIYNALKHGITVDALEKPPRQLAEPIALPYGIAAGLADVSKRTEWNKTASAECGLPTETWREVVARRKRYEEVHARLVAGQVTQINDLITLNLDIRQFAQDVLATYEGSDLIAAFYRAIAGRVPENSKEGFEQGLSVLDPTCGSGAFLFAALSVLEPLVETCIERMRSFVEEADRQGRTRAYPAFRRALTEISKHLNDEYFILKTIIIGNLYGVDIMQEATEICKLRLFLKLVAHTKRNEGRKNMGLEPLPDIDFNIRAGNTLVGFTSLEEAKRATANKLDWEAGKTLAEIDEGAREADHAYKLFREMQVVHGLQDSKQHEFKSALRERLASLANKLDRYLAEVYGKDPHKQKEFEAWRKSYQPFHWFTEFYGIITSGGFDVIIGNPPYVEMTKVRDYKIHSYATSECGNLYAPCVERGSLLLASQGRFGMIVPLSGFSTERMREYQELLWNRYGQLYISYYSGDAHPSVFFSGVKYRLCIIIGSPTKSRETEAYITNYLRWYADARDSLFPLLHYTSVPFRDGFLRFTKLGDSLTTQIIKKMLKKHQTLGNYLRKQGMEHITYHRSPVFWIRSMDFEPYFKSPTRERSEDHLKDLYFNDNSHAKVTGAIINSTCFYLWFTVQGNCRNVTGADIEKFPVGNLDAPSLKPLKAIYGKLMKDLQKNSKRRVYNYELSGRVEYDEFYPNKSKPIIDDIDRILGVHYGFTDEELDFIINYDIKYRMGRDTEESSNE